MFWKKKEDKLIQGSEEGNVLNQTEEQNQENNSEVLGMAFKEPVVEDTLKETEVGDFASSTIGAMSMENSKKQAPITKEK